MIEFIGDPKSTEHLWYKGEYDRYHFRVKYKETNVLCAIEVTAIENIYDDWNDPTKGFIDNMNDILSRVEILLSEAEELPYENDGVPVVIVKSN